MAYGVVHQFPRRVFFSGERVGDGYSGAGQGSFSAVGSAGNFIRGCRDVLGFGLWNGSRCGVGLRGDWGSRAQSCRKRSGPIASRSSPPAMILMLAVWNGSKPYEDGHRLIVAA